MNTAWFDWLVFGSYLAIVFGFGIYMSRREGTPDNFFLAGRRLPWYAIALSLFATNISSGSLVGLAGDGYRVGLAVGTLEWGSLLGLFLLAFVFVPYYQRSSISTTPQLLELRYNVTARLLFSGAVIFFEMAIFMPFLFYTGGLAIEVLFGVPLEHSVVAIAIFVGVYTTFGGLGAVVWTDVVQGLFMMAGAMIVTVLGLVKVGGIDSLVDAAREKMHVCLPADHPEYLFPATMVGGYFLVTVYFWCQNQTIVQRVLGARTEWDDRGVLHQAGPTFPDRSSGSDRFCSLPRSRCGRQSPANINRRGSSKRATRVDPCRGDRVVDVVGRFRAQLVGDPFYLRFLSAADRQKGQPQADDPCRAAGVHLPARRRRHSSSNATRQ